ncbi:hypothetical protein GF391_03610 [Candidatus Uhrbacteria bacterium]|nr:hypothetical protein [Candidatus Uhrbacteria bacterium]
MKMNTAPRTSAAPAPRTSTRSIRASAEYARILAKFVEQIQMRPDWSVTLADLDRGVRQALSNNERNRRARLRECPACGLKRRVAPYTLCKECAKEAAREDERQAKSKAKSPSHKESARLSERIIRRQYRAAAHKLFELWEAGQLPEGAEVLRAEGSRLEIKVPGTLFRLDLTELCQDAPVLSFPASTQEIDTAWEATG